MRLSAWKSRVRAHDLIAPLALSMLLEPVAPVAHATAGMYGYCVQPEPPAALRRLRRSPRHKGRTIRRAIAPAENTTPGGHRADRNATQRALPCGRARTHTIVVCDTAAFT